MGGVTVRAARAGDAPALVPIFAAWEHPQPEAVIAERLAGWEATPYACVLVAELGGDVAGVAAVSAAPHLARPGRLARLTGLAVGDGFRRRGVATALVRSAESLAREWDCDRLEATSRRSRADAPAFYPALGYEDVSPRSARYVRDL